MEAGTGSGTTVELSDYPDTTRLHVYVDGVEVTAGWSYQTVNNAIAFDVALPEGTTVEVVYERSYCP